jgi:hypothetical protein
MFVTKGLYERAPYYWIVAGVALIFLGTYLGSTVSSIWYFVGIGAGTLVCAWGLRVFRQRLANENREACTTYDDYLKQTCELDLSSIDPE